MKSKTFYLNRIILVAIVYFVTGRLGLNLAIPPGYATIVWLPSGIALAAVLVYGYRVLPGVWLGSFMTNVLTSFSMDAILGSVTLPAVIGLGASVQAFAGAYLVKRYIGYPNSLANEKDVIKFFLIIGPISCMVNSLIGPSSMLLLGLISVPNFPFTWWNWWVGDSIGGMIVTPIILIFKGEPQNVWRKKKTTVALPVAITFILVVLLFIYVKHQEDKHIRQDFEDKSNIILSSIQRNFDVYRDTLKAIEHLFATVKHIGRNDFHNFITGLIGKHEGIQALEWIPRVPDNDRIKYESLARQDGFSGFQIMDKDSNGKRIRSQNREEYFPVYFIEPYEGNEMALGFNIASDPTRYESLVKARDIAQAVTTAPIALVQEKQGQPGFLIFAPVYMAGLPNDTVVERQRNLKGFVLGVFRVSDLVEWSLRNLRIDDIEFKIYDNDATKTPFYSYKTSALGTGSGNDTGIYKRSELMLPGRAWNILFSPTMKYIERVRSFQAWALLAGSMLFIGLLNSFLFVLAGRNERVSQLVEERSEELRKTSKSLKESEERFRNLFESAPDAILIADMDTGFIVNANHKASVLFMRPCDELVGTHQLNLHNLIKEDFSIHMFEEYVELTRQGIDTHPIELTILHSENVEVPVEITAQGIVINGKQYIMGIFRNVTERKRIEIKLEEVRRQLQSIINSTTAVIFLKDTQGRYMLINSHYEVLFHITKEAIIGKTDYDIFPKDAADSFRANDIEVMKKNTALNFEEIVPHEDGIHTYISIKFPLVDIKGQIYAVCGIATDITERKRIEEDLNRKTTQLESLTRELERMVYDEINIRNQKEQLLIQQSKMAAMGEMIGMIAHQWRQPLNALSASIFDIKDAYEYGELDKKYIDDIIQISKERISFMIRTINDFAKFLLPSKEKTLFNVKDIIDDMLYMFGGLYKKNNIEIDIETLGEESALISMGYPNELKQVILNLLNNARDAVLNRRGKEKQGIVGCIKIIVSKSDDNIIVSIRDNGGGIPEHIIDKIFEPYFTTKEKAGGTGIGLYMSKIIVETNMGGTLTVRNVDEGAEFMIRLQYQGAIGEDI
ncbi:MAG: CHASE domain-containing protein [Nitrospirae bacterium]|nr:CHASE domain-containing protein [Nitrospirota bacterium]